MLLSIKSNLGVANEFRYKHLHKCIVLYGEYIIRDEDVSRIRTFVYWKRAASEKMSENTFCRCV